MTDQFERTENEESAPERVGRNGSIRGNRLIRSLAIAGLHRPGIATIVVAHRPDADIAAGPEGDDRDEVRWCFGQTSARRHPAAGGALGVVSSLPWRPRLSG
jgi:hypothetical protein